MQSSNFNLDLHFSGCKDTFTSWYDTYRGAQPYRYCTVQLKNTRCVCEPLMTPTATKVSNLCPTFWPHSQGAYDISEEMNWQCLRFTKVGQRWQSNSWVQHLWNRQNGVVIKNMKALSFMVRKLWAILKFFKSRSKLRVKVTYTKLMIPLEKSCHNEHTYQIWKPSLMVRKIWGIWCFSKVGQR